MRYHFTWNAAKARSNVAKHGIPFEAVVAVFEDPLCLTRLDAQHRDRWVTVGAANEQLLVVVHTDVETKTGEGEDLTRIRIISARRATKRERRAYRGGV